MDARATRTRTALHDAVLALAAEQPIDEISAAAVSRAAGITRDTFYRHAESPLELLADALGSELDALRTRLDETPTIRDAERHLLEHVRDRAAVYRGTMHPSIAAPVRARLELQLRAGLEDWARRQPGIVPPRLAGDPTALRMAVAYASAGTVGAIEEWLRQGALDVESGIEIVLTASPAWWLD